MHLLSWAWQLYTTSCNMQMRNGNRWITASYNIPVCICVVLCIAKLSLSSTICIDQRKPKVLFCPYDELPPVVRSHATVHHADVFRDRLHFMNTLLIIQNGFLFLLCCKDNSIGRWKQGEHHNGFYLFPHQNQQVPFIVMFCLMQLTIEACLSSW